MKNKQKKKLEERGFNSKKATFFWHLMPLRNLQEKLLDKNRSELRKKDIVNVIDLLLAVGVRHKSLSDVFLGSYPIRKRVNRRYIITWKRKDTPIPLLFLVCYGSCCISPVAALSSR